MLIQNLHTNSSASKMVTIQAMKSSQCEKGQMYVKSNEKQKIRPLDKNFSGLNSQTHENNKSSKILFQSHENKNDNQPNPHKFNKLLKSNSQTKIRSYKEEILKIPKVKQILQKDKLVFKQDIQKRLQLIGDVKNQNFIQKEVLKLNAMRKPIQQNKKKNRRHKTNYKIPLTRKNINNLNNLIEEHISHNQFYKNQEFIFLSQKDYKQPFDLRKLKFMDEINPLKKKYKQKFPQLKQGVLSKNKLLLQHVILNRNIKRQMKLEQKKLKNQQKQVHKESAKQQINS